MRGSFRDPEAFKSRKLMLFVFLGLPGQELPAKVVWFEKVESAVAVCVKVLRRADGPAAPGTTGFSPTGLKNISRYGTGYRKAQKGVIPMSGKSPKSGAVKKAGKTILEKRADKRAKNENSELNFAKPRKNQR